MIDPWLHDLKDGERVLVLAYGASNSGKTYTIQGTPEDRGLIFPIISKYLNQNDAKIQISFLEIYQETMKDLVTGDHVTLSCFENGSFKGLSETSLVDMDSATKLIDSTLLNRQNGKTNSNYNSSRSHLLMILSINIASVNFKICIGDLAGSEKVSEERGKSQTEVITQLENNQSHVSWRNSVLTSCLKTFFDHGKVALIFHVDPTNVSESKQTFEFTAVCARVSKLEQQKSPLLKYNSNADSLKEISQLKTDLAKRNQEFIDSRTEINQLLLQVSRHAEEINEKEQIINNYVNLIPKYQQLLDQKETDMQESLYKAGLKETTKLLMAQEIYSKNLDEKDEKIKCLEEECVELNSKVFDLKAQVLELTGQAAVFMNENGKSNVEFTSTILKLQDTNSLLVQEKRDLLKESAQATIEYENQIREMQRVIDLVNEKAASRLAKIRVYESREQELEEAIETAKESEKLEAKRKKEEAKKLKKLKETTETIFVKNPEVFKETEKPSKSEQLFAIDDSSDNRIAEIIDIVEKSEVKEKAKESVVSKPKAVKKPKAVVNETEEVDDDFEVRDVEAKPVKARKLKTKVDGETTEKVAKKKAHKENVSQEVVDDSLLANRKRDLEQEDNEKSQNENIEVPKKKIRVRKLIVKSNDIQAEMERAVE